MYSNYCRQYGMRYLEEFAHSDVVETIGAVEHDALLGDCLREILHRLGFAYFYKYTLFCILVKE